MPSVAISPKRLILYTSYTDSYGIKTKKNHEAVFVYENACTNKPNISLKYNEPRSYQSPLTILSQQDLEMNGCFGHFRQQLYVYCSWGPYNNFHDTIIVWSL